MVKELAELIGVNAADIIRELIKSGIFASINQVIDRDTATLVTNELGYEVAEPSTTETTIEASGEAPAGEDAKGVIEDSKSDPEPEPKKADPKKDEPKKAEDAKKPEEGKKADEPKKDAPEGSSPP